MEADVTAVLVAGDEAMVKRVDEQPTPGGRAATRERAKMLLIQGRIETSVDPARSIELLAEARRGFADVGDADRVAECDMALGRVEAGRGDRVACEEHFAAAIMPAAALSRAERAVRHTELMHAYCVLNELGAAAASLRHANDDLVDASALQTGLVRYADATFRSRTGDRAGAVTAYRAARTELDHAPVTEERIRCSLAIGEHLAARRRRREAIIEFDRASADLDMFEAHDELRFRALVDVGLTASKLGRWAQSERALNRAIRNAAAEGASVTTRGRIELALGVAMVKQKRRAQSVPHLRSSIAFFEAAGAETELAEAWRWLRNAYSDLRWDEASAQASDRMRLHRRLARQPGVRPAA